MSTEYTERIKVTIVENGNVDYQLNLIAERFFPLRGKGNLSAALRWCVEYALKREEKDGMVTGLWVELPIGRIPEVAVTLHNLVAKSYTVQLNVADIHAMDLMAKEKTEITNRRHKRVEVFRYPNFRGLRRNVIIQCVEVVMSDINEYAIAGNTLKDLRDLEKFHGIKTAMSNYAYTIGNLDTIIMGMIVRNGYVTYEMLMNTLPVNSGEFMPILNDFIKAGSVVKRQHVYVDKDYYTRKETRYEFTGVSA
jgi:hypothetical protein